MRMRSYPARKGSAKYSNKKVVIDGVKFDSIAESKYYSVAKHYAKKFQSMHPIKDATLMIRQRQSTS